MILKELLKNQIIYDYRSGIEIRPNDDDPSLPLVEFKLIPTPVLIRVADAIREEATDFSFSEYDESEFTRSEKDTYEFYYGLNTEDGYLVDTFIMFGVMDPDAEDFEELYTIDLSQAEQRLIRSYLDAQFRETKGKICDDLLREAAAKIQGATS